MSTSEAPPKGSPHRVGVDVVEIDRFRRVLERTPAVARRLFTAAEQERLARRSDPVPGLAARFAAKEAVMKALGAGIGAVSLTDIEIGGGAGVPPSIVLSGRAHARAEHQGVRHWSVSLSHTHRSATAVVVAS